MATRFPGFPPEALPFLRQLKKHNDRDWFQPRKDVYTEKVRGPMGDLVMAVNEAFAEFAPEYQTDPKKAIYRIYRDVRFSNDKSPYKTHIGANFPHRRLEKHAGGGYYFHIAPDEIFIAGGVYMPGSKELLAIRRKLSAEAGAYRSLIKAREFKKYFPEVEGEKLKRPPKGFSPDDPAQDLLLHKQFLVMERLDPKIAETSKVAGEITKRFRAMAPWIEFLNEALL